MEVKQNAPENPAIWDILGGVRFVLALIVIACHLNYFCPPGSFAEHVTRFSGLTAVLCFLVISGYSIAASLARDTSQFYRRRVLRIYPIYFLTVIASVAIGCAAHAPNCTHLKNILSNLLFLQTFCAAVLTANVILWSLGVEVACYIAAPYLHRMRTSTLVGIAAISAAAFAYFPHLHLMYYAWLSGGQALLFLSWSWLAGFLYYRHRHEAHAGILLLGVMVVLTTINSVYAEKWQHITLACSIGLLVTGKSIALSQVPRKVLKYLGDLSFPLYLLHFPIYRVCVEVLHIHMPSVAVSMALVAAAGALIVDAKLRRPCSLLCEWCETLAEELRLSTGQMVHALQNIRPLQGALSRVGPISIMVAFTGSIFYLTRFRLLPNHMTRGNQSALVTSDTLTLVASASPPVN